MNRVLVLMGSDSDWPKVKPAVSTLKGFGVNCRVRVLSAHRTPHLVVEAIKEAEAEGVELFMAAAGQAAHLAGVVAAHTTKPVIGLPIANGALSGQDALYSTVMMPPGIPVATVAIDGGKNAGILAAQILGVADKSLAQAVADDRKAMVEKVLSKDAAVQKDLP